jgi:ferredoxin-NADP reductase/MOSC domain-containing protein YiiM
MTPRLLSVNVGMPADVSWNGTSVHTGIWKRSVHGPQYARRLNLDGDGQGDTAGHGGEHRAVLVYQLESYRYWEQVLGRQDFTYGQFGENFTVTGLADDEVCIGDRFRIGDAEFEVTQPRVTCYRVGIRLDEPRMAAMLVSHHRPGFYLRVLHEGVVQAGDEIIKTAGGTPAMTVAAADALLYLPGRERDDLERAVRIEALSPGWRTSFQELLDELSAPRQDDDRWSGFRPLTVTGIRVETGSVRSVRLAEPAGRRLPRPLPGQYVTVKLPAPGGGGADVRSYSLSSAPDDREYRISVKREPRGRVSGYVHDGLVVGQTVDVARPRGEFVLAAGDDPVVLASAGIGVTPVLAMLHELATRQPAREVIWIQVARTAADRPLADETDGLLAVLPDGTAHLFFTRDAPPPAVATGHVHTGRPTPAVVAALGLPRAADAYLCGPVGFMTGLRESLLAAGLRADRIHAEVFGGRPALTPGVRGTSVATPHQPGGPAGAGPQVTFARSGLTTRWSDRFGSLLELAEACAVPTRWACRTGVCHTCETALITGRVRYRPDPLEPPPGDGVLICCARPEAELALDL